MLLTKDAILTANDLVTEDVEVPEWGGAVRVRSISGAERDAFEQAIVTRKGKNVTTNMANIRAKMVALSLVDESGQRLFSDSDVVALGRKSAAALDRVFSVAQRLAGLTDTDVDELAENLEAGQNEGSTSA
jgi:hypothetical protein